MCGFNAIFSPRRGCDREALAHGLRTLRHRGPDREHLWIAEDRRIGLGHARLSIIDLSSSGDQPMANADGSIHAVVNGEFYDFERIRDELEKDGHRFHTRSDSEILLHLYERYGTDCLHHLRGEFAFILWDAHNHTLFAARDRFGIKPLFHATVGEDLHLASEAKALFAAGVPRHWDEETVFQMHAGGGMSPGRSLFRGVEQLPPGHYMIVTPNHRRIMKYWDFDYPLQTSDVFIKDPAEALRLFRETFEEAVRLRLRADVPVACYLSGGLDSCSILGTAAKLSEKPIHAFTLTFESGHYDESAIAEEMAAHAGSPYSPLHIRSRDLAENFAEALWHGETIFFNAHAVAKFLLSQFVRDHGFKVVLTGEGSDEILGGYVHFRRDWLLYNSEVLDPAERQRLLDEMERNNVVSRIMLRSNGEESERSHVQKVLGFVPTFMRAGHFSGGLHNLFTTNFNERFAGWDSSRTFLNEVDVQGQLRGRDPLNQSLYLWSKTTLPNYLLSVLGDRMEMAHSIEGRVPFLDHKLVELMRRIPVSEKIKAMREKHLLREAAKPVLTDTVYRREKHPFLTPPAASSQDQTLHDFLNDTLRGSALAKVDFYDQKAVKRFLDQSAKASAEDQALLDPILMTILSFTLLQERFGLGVSS